MSISKENIRTVLTISKELKSKLETIAKQENRSFNNLVITLLKNFVNEREK